MATTDDTHLTGRVTQSLTGSGLAGIRVTAYQQLIGGLTALGSVFTDSSGYYTVTVAAPAAVKLLYEDVTDVLVDEWYSDVPYSNEQQFVYAQPIDATSDVTGLNVSLAVGASISGRVVDDATGLPVASVAVVAYGADGEAARAFSADPDGAFVLRGLLPGRFRLHLLAPSANNAFIATHIDEWHPNAAQIESADVVTASTSVTATVDLALRRGAVVTGSVLDGRTGTYNISVGGVLFAGSCLQTRAVAFGAPYRLGGLAPAPTSLYFVPFGLNVPIDFKEQYYDGADTASQQTLITPTLGVTQSNVNASLMFGNVITVNLADANGQPATSAQPSRVGLRLLTSPTVTVQARTRPVYGSALYEAHALIDGDFRVAYLGDDNHAPAYFGGGVGFQATASILLAGAQSRTITLTLPAASSAGRITGRIVTSDTGLPLAGVAVKVHLLQDSVLVASATTDVDGNYTSTLLLPGSYVVRADTAQPANAAFASEWSGGSAVITDALPITVTAGGAIRHDFRLQRGGVIAGTVTDQRTGLPIHDVAFEIYDQAGQLIGPIEGVWEFTHTDYAGRFRTSVLKPGSYRVRVLGKVLRAYPTCAPVDAFAPRFVGGASELSGATPITVSTGSTSSVSQTLQLVSDMRATFLPLVRR